MEAGAATAGYPAARVAEAGHTASRVVVAGAAAGLLAEAVAAALVRADGATRGTNHCVRGWKLWVCFQESEGLELGSLLAPWPLLYPAEGLL